MSDNSGNWRYYRKKFVREFIELYKSLPSVWNVKSKEYMDRQKKHNDYLKLVEKLKTVEPNATRAMVVRKINSLRSCYRKQKIKLMKSLESDPPDKVYKTTLWYYPLLEFLEGNEDSGKQTYFIDVEDTINDIQEIEDNDDNEEDIEEPPTATLPVPIAKHGPKNQSVHSAPIIKRRHYNPVQPSNITKRQNVDSHDVFGRNVACKLRNLARDQRIFAEKIINDALFEAELGNLNRYCTVQVPVQVNNLRECVKVEHDCVSEED